jgi:hypothetical protein
MAVSQFSMARTWQDCSVERPQQRDFSLGWRVSIVKGKAAEIYLSVLVLGEIRKGLERGSEELG